MANYNEIFKSKMDWQNVFVRTGNFPLDRSSIFGSYEDALAYAKGDGSDSRALGLTSYVGQIIAVYENDAVSIYKIIGKDIMDSNAKTVEVKERGIEELISRTDVNTLISASILSEDFKDQVKDIISKEDINAEKVKTNEKITIIGTPLAQVINPDNSLDVTLDNLDMQTILKVLLEKELYPTNVVFTEGTVNHVTPKPTISLSVNHGSYVEVGTNVTVNRINATTIGFTTTNRTLKNIEYGYSLFDNDKKEFSETEIIKEPIETFVNNGTYKISSVYNGYGGVNNQTSTATTQNGAYISSHTVIVNEGANKITVNYEAPKVSAKYEAIPDIYFCSNLQKTDASQKENTHPSYIASANTISSSQAEHIVYGTWYLYMGGVDGTFTPNSKNVRDVGRKDMRAAGTQTHTSSKACDNVVIAFPSSWGALKQVKDNGSNTFITGNFGSATTITLRGANEYGEKTYKVYVYSPANRLNNGFNYTITIG